MKHRKLRIAWSVAWGIAVLLTIVLWGRSLLWHDELRVPATGSSILRFTSNRGHLKCGYWETGYAPQLNRFELVGGEVEAESSERFESENPTWEWRGGGDGIVRSISFPHWLLAVVLGGISATAWVSFRRFSLRTLLIATTLVAVGLGLIVWLTSAR